MLILNEKELLDRLAAAGHAIPASRFARWREQGLVPTMDRPGLGQGKGRATHRYSEAAFEQTLQIARMRAQNLDLDEIGWRLWLDGYDVDRHWWLNNFKFAAKQFDKGASAIRKAQESDEFAENQIDRMIASCLKAKSSNRFFKQIRKSLGPKRFAAVMNEVASMATGTFEAISSQQALDSKESIGDKRAMDVGLGMVHAQTDTVNGVGPIIAGDYSPILQATFEPLKGTSLTDFLQHVDPLELRRVGKSLMRLLDAIAAGSAAFERAFEKDAFGLRRAAMLARLDRNIHAGMILVWTLIHQKSREEFHDFDAMAKLFLNAAIGARKLLQASDFDPGSGRPKFRRAISKKPMK